MMTRARQTEQARQLREELERCERLLQEVEACRNGAEALGDSADQADLASAMGPWLKSHYEAQRDALREALYLCESGCYGVCETCAGSIESGRIKAMPCTRLCLTCQKASERRRALGGKHASRRTTQRRELWTP